MRRAWACWRPNAARGGGVMGGGSVRTSSVPLGASGRRRMLQRGAGCDVIARRPFVRQCTERRFARILLRASTVGEVRRVGANDVGRERPVRDGDAVAKDGGGRWRGAR